MEEAESRLTVASSVTLNVEESLDCASLCCEREYIWDILNTEVGHTKKKKENPPFFLKVHGILGAKFSWTDIIKNVARPGECCQHHRAQHHLTSHLRVLVGQSLHFPSREMVEAVVPHLFKIKSKGSGVGGGECLLVGTPFLLMASKQKKKGLSP